MIVVCGNYTGGCLRYFPNDDGKIALEKMESNGSDIHDINCKPFYFKGAKAHSTEPFQGTRYSFVFFCIRKIPLLPEDQCQYLTDLGFVLPSNLGNGAQGHESEEETRQITPTKIDCNMGETVTTIEGIRRHCQFHLETNQPP